MDWVRRAGEYRVLTGKRDRLCYPLGEREQARLSDCERFFTHDANRRRVPWASREQIRAPISIVVQFGDTVGRAQDISGEGLYIVTPRPLELGERTVVRISDEPLVVGEDDAVEAPYEEWQFGAEVVRIDAGGMGLRFVGIPLALRICHKRAELDPVQHAA